MLYFNHKFYKNNQYLNFLISFYIFYIFKMSYTGGLNAFFDQDQNNVSEWHRDGNWLSWHKLDAISIIIMRFYTVMFIISIVVSVISLLFVNKMVKDAEKFAKKK